MSGAFGLSLYFRMVHPRSCWPALLYNASHSFAIAEVREHCRLALPALGLFVRGFFFQMRLQNQADVIRQRALGDVRPTLQLVPFG